MHECLSDELLADVARPDRPRPPWGLAGALVHEGGQDDAAHEGLDHEREAAEEGARRRVDGHDGRHEEERRIRRHGARSGVV